MTRVSLGQTPGLVGHWTFDDPANLGKDSASTNHGRAVGGAVACDERIGTGALSVNGVDGRIGAGSPALRFSITQNYTVSAWVYVSELRSAWVNCRQEPQCVPWYGLWINSANRWVAAPART